VVNVSLNGVSLVELTVNEVLSGYRRFLQPEAAAMLMQAASPMLAFGAVASGTPIGLGLFRRIGAGMNAQALSVAVDANHRKQGIGRAILAHGWQMLQDRGCRRLNAEFLSDSDSAEGRDRIRFLETCGFQPFEQGIHVRTGPFTALLDQDWLRLTLPSAFSVDPWISLTANERQYLERCKGVEYEETFSPFVDEDTLDRERSVLLRYKGSPIGWNLLEPVDEKTMLGRTMCVFIRHRKLARGVGLFAESIRRLMAEGVYSNGMFFVSHENEPMRAFMERHFASPLLRKQVLWRSHQTIVCES
jgi:GNAT superfamily N-acetyltransferase